MMFSPHAQHLWSDSIGSKFQGSTFAVPNGNAIFFSAAMRASSSPCETYCLPLSADGNTAAVVINNTEHLCCISVHLETESKQSREQQIESLLQFVAVERGFVGPLSPWVVIIAGDFNTSSSSSEVQPLFSVGFECVSYRPGSSAFGAEPYGWVDTPIDHVFVFKNKMKYDDDGKIRSIPLPAPIALADVFDESVPLGRKIEWELRTFGSDHVPVGATIFL
eukprot:PhF_6_TR35724/c0_g1_i3/m.51872